MPKFNLRGVWTRITAVAPRSARIAIGIVLAAAVVVGGSFAARAALREQALQRSLTTPELREQYAKARAFERSPGDPMKRFDEYTGAGFNWKSLGDATGEEEFYRRAIRVYERQVLGSRGRFSLPYLNIATIVRDLGEPERAEQMYRKALEVDPGDSVIYLALIELMRVDLRKSPDEVLLQYDRSIDRLVFSKPLIASKAAYLNSLGRLQESLDLYALLLAYDPENSIFQTEYLKLKQELDAKP
ncbi:MAG: tetratricopeptide repeat protein [Patescibacteria group bacterium]